MKRLAVLFSLSLALLGGAPEAQALSLSVVTPSGGERLLAPTRDFYVVVSLDREGGSPASAPFDVRFELFRQGRSEPLRRVQSAVAAGGLTPDEAISLDYEGGWTPSTSADLLATPPPDLVFDPSRPRSFFDPTVKAVVRERYAAALLLGGRTKGYDSDDAGEDLTSGSYRLVVTAVDGEATLASADVPLTFAPVADKVLSRFSPARHMETVRAFAAEEGARLYLDPFPGYWDGSHLPSGTASTLFYEIVRRWRPNDSLEYLGGTVRAVLYNIHETSTSQSVEIGAMAGAGRLDSEEILWYRYDIGEMAVSYDRGDGTTVLREGLLVPFGAGEGLALTRAEIRDGDGAESDDGRYDPDDGAKRVDWNVDDGVTVRHGERVSLFGVVRPLQPLSSDVEAGEDGRYSVKNRAVTVHYALFDGERECLSFDREVGLVRTGINDRASIYEFRHDLVLPEGARRLSVRLWAVDSHGEVVAGTEKIVPLVWGGGGGGCSLGYGALLLLVAPLAFLAARRG